MCHLWHDVSVVTGQPIVLVVDDDLQIARMVQGHLKRWGFEVIAVESGEAGLAALESRRIDVAMVDLNMPGINGLGVLEEIRDRWPACRTMLMTGAAGDDTKLQAVKLGALDYLDKPLDWKYLEQRFAAIREDCERSRRLAVLEHEIAEQSSFQGLIGRSAAMRELHDLIRRMAPYARTVLITGETGTGKELVARAMHQSGRRAGQPMVSVNCAAVSETLVESELFGHVRGAFTGAIDAKRGLIEHANGGTLFLDEIGELPLTMQAKFLRVLESGEFYRVGSVESRRVDVTILAATNRDLEADVRAGRFRQDLYYRLNVVELHVPALRDHRDDISALTASFLAESGQRMNKPINGLVPAAERLLMSAPWPGNVRQLRNVIERAVMLADGSELDEHDLRVALGQTSAAGAAVDSMPAEPLGERPVTGEQIEAALERAGGNRLEAARLLGVSRRTFYRLLDRFDLRHILKR